MFEGSVYIFIMLFATNSLRSGLKNAACLSLREFQAQGKMKPGQGI